MDKLKHITVVAGLIYNKDKYLIGRRKPDDLGGGYWEFPGGKLEDGEEVEPHVEYYGGEDEAPEISKSLNEMVEIDMGEEYVYLWFMGEWNCYSVGRKYDEHWNVIKTNISPVIIPQEQKVA